VGYFASEMGQTAELRLPADRSYIVVAKRAAAAMGSVAGFHLEAIDDLTIAVSQAFENSIACLERFGAHGGEVRLVFKLAAEGLEVTVRSTVTRDAELEAQARAAAAQVVELQAHELALRLMGLFVDDSSYRVDERTGGLRVRLTKYRVT
jgi:anti-sigma regulatory factor (Ser/Thr protein kinase)